MTLLACKSGIPRFGIFILWELVIQVQVIKSMRTTALYRREAEVEYIVGSSNRSPSELLKQASAELARKAGLVELAELSPELSPEKWSCD